MKKIKVYLQYPWGISDSQYYKSILENPPKGIEFFPKNQKVGMIVNKKKIFLNYLLKNKIRLLIEKFNLPIPNLKKVKDPKRYGVIHCAHCLPSNYLDFPWIADFEDRWQMWISGRDTKKGIEKVRKILNSPSCKKILAWTSDAKDNILKRYPEIKNKIEIVGFGQKVQEFKKIKSNKVRLLFVARFFYEKGGLHALEAIDVLTKKYNNVEATVISTIPAGVLQKYSKNNKIKFFELVPHKKLIEEIFPACDILIYPGYSDTFGFVFPEASSFGIPVVTVDGFARKELVKNGKTGIIIEKPHNFEFKEAFSSNQGITKRIIEETSKLIENKNLRRKMSYNSLREVSSGTFSIKKRNEKLKAIYLETLS